VSKLTKDENDAQKLLEKLHERELNGEVEFCHPRVDPSGTLVGVTWAYTGSKRIVERCGEIAFWDSTLCSIAGKRLSVEEFRTFL